LASVHDPWHDTISNLFNIHIFPDESIVLLYVNPVIVNEVLHLSTKSLKQFTDKFNISFSKQEYEDLQEFTQNMLTVFLEEGIINVLDGDSESVKQQIRLSNELGAADASNVSTANLYGTNFMTVDNKLVHNIKRLSHELSNIEKVYYTTPSYRTY
jgi:predicted adenine nucleotide alpha hydrolase (AANH) superfamily ATPase